MRIGTTIINNQKLTPAQVQQVRDLCRVGFSFSSISRAFAISYQEIANIHYGRCWKALPDVPGRLPQLNYDAAQRLRVRSRTVTPAQQKLIDQYRTALAAQFDLEADREGAAVSLLNHWVPRRPNDHRREVTTRLSEGSER